MKQYRNLILLILLGFFFACKSSKKNVESDTYKFIDGNKKIELVIPDNKINLDESTFGRLYVSNIPTNDIIIVGAGNRYKKVTNSYIDIEIITNSKYYLNKNKYILKVSYKENLKKIEHVFEIPLKK